MASQGHHELTANVETSRSLLFRIIVIIIITILVGPIIYISICFQIIFDINAATPLAKYGNNLMIENIAMDEQ